MKNVLIKLFNYLPKYITHNIIIHNIRFFLNKNFFMKDNIIYSVYDIGNYSYWKPLIVSFNTKSTCKIWKFCSIANGVQLLLNAEHKVNRISTYPPSLILENYQGEDFVTSRGDIIIWNDVRIGTNAIIMSGVKIWDWAVIAANAVVTKDVAPYEIVWWVPAKHIKFRFSSHHIESLLIIKRWDWHIVDIQKNYKLLFSSKIDDLLSQYK